MCATATGHLIGQVVAAAFQGSLFSMPAFISAPSTSLSVCGVFVALSERLVGDRADDSDPLDEKLAVDGVELIAPYRGKGV
jgi:hypothetical protein